MKIFIETPAFICKRLHSRPKKMPPRGGRGLTLPHVAPLSLDLVCVHVVVVPFTLEVLTDTPCSILTPCNVNVFIDNFHIHSLLLGGRPDDFFLYYTICGRTQFDTKFSDLFKKNFLKMKAFS